MARAKFKPDYIVIHHGGRAHHTFEDVDRWHRDKGWNGCGYHYVIEHSGLIRRGRPETKQGAHVSGGNHRALGILVMGIHNAAPPNGTQLQALYSKLGELCKEFDFPAGNVVGHREAPGRIPGAKPTRKLCPGRAFDMDDLRERLRAMPWGLAR